jgi:Tfp pilus assembly protein PilP
MNLSAHMLKKSIAVCSLPILMILMVCFSGCGKQDEPAQDPEVKSFKIEKAVKGNEASPQGDGLSPGGTVDSLLKSSGSDVSTAEAGKTGIDGTNPPSSLSGPIPGSASSPSGLAPTPMFALGGPAKTESEATYNPAGRIDPFEPLFQTKAGKGASGVVRSQTIRDARKGKLTPLENLDISQMKLTAIIISPQRSIAMVQESTGKGHVIKKGTFIGINSGRVVDIRQNEVIIEEEVEDLLGKIIVRKRELKLQKPLGEM